MSEGKGLKKIEEKELKIVVEKYNIRLDAYGYNEVWERKDWYHWYSTTCPNGLQAEHFKLGFPMYILMERGVVEGKVPVGSRGHELGNEQILTGIVEHFRSENNLYQEYKLIKIEGEIKEVRDGEVSIELKKASGKKIDKKGVLSIDFVVLGTEQIKEQI